MKLEIKYNLVVALLLMVVMGVFAQSKPKMQTGSMSEYFADAQSLNPTFSFVQLSGLNFDVANEQSVENLKVIINDINSSKKAAFVIISGDVAANGDEASYKAIKKMLDRLICPYYLIAGERDNTILFKRYFGDDKIRIKFNNIAFVGINTAPLIENSDPHVLPQDIIWTLRQLKNIGKKTPVYVVTHHPMLDGEVDNWFDFTDAIRHYNIQAIFSSHSQVDRITSCDGITGLLSHSSLGGYHLYDLYADSIEIFYKEVGGAAQSLLTLPIEPKIYIEGNTKDFPRADYSINNENKNVKVVWRKNIGYGIATPARFDDLKCYVEDMCGTKYAFDLKKGKPQKQFTYPLEDNKNADIDLVTTKNGVVIVQKDGAVVWQYKISNVACFATSLGGGDYIITDMSGNVVKINVR